MTQNRKIRLFTVAASFVALMAPVTISASQAQSGNLHYPDTELSRSSTRAKLAPELENVPAMPQPVVNTRAGRSGGASREVSQKLQSPGRRHGKSKTALRTSKGKNTSRLASNARLHRQSRTVIGTDDRQVVTDTTIAPMRSMTKLYMTYPNGKTYMCSGAMIAAKYVLTAGHCVHSKADGGWATKIEVIPALNGSYKPYGSAFATNLRSYSGWSNNQDSNFDMALVTLDREIGNTTGWLNYAALSSVNSVNATITGYPADRSNGLKLYTHSGKVASSTATRLAYPIDTAPGQSGSPIYQQSSGATTVIGVHTNGTANGKTNSGTRLDKAKFQNLQTWISSGT